MFRKKEETERCLGLNCRKFLTNDHMNTGMCVDCAELTITGIKRYLKTRSIAGAGFVAGAFVLLPAVNALFWTGDVQVTVPVVRALLNLLNTWTFETIAGFGAGRLVLYMFFVYFLAFAKKAGFSNDIKYKADTKVKNSDVTYTHKQWHGLWGYSLYKQYGSAGKNR